MTTLGFCLPLLETKKFLQAIKSGELDLVKLSEITDSAERRAVFEPYVGKENAQAVNALFEQKLLMKDWQQAMIGFIKKAGNMNPVIKRDLIAKIEKMEKVLSPTEEGMLFQDLAAKKLGLETISKGEMANIVDLSSKVSESKTPTQTIVDTLKNEGKTNDEINLIAQDVNSELFKARSEYGLALENLREYIGELKSKQMFSSEKLLKEPKQTLAYIKENPIQGAKDVLYMTASNLKSIIATLDNSFFGRQGIKMLLSIRNADIWAKNSLSSWNIIGKELMGQDTAKAIRAEVYSRPNALNGKYDALGSGSGLRVNQEEAFPGEALKKVPGIKRIFNAAENAYNLSALRMRADYADRLIQMAEDNGINTLDKLEMSGIGNLVGSMTGRGKIKFLNESGQKYANALLFSPKFLKSNFDTLTAHMFDTDATPFVKKEAAKNLASIVGSLAVVLAISKMINNKSVDQDPHSSRFGKIKIGATTFDLTGGMGGIATLASRLLIPKKINGEWKLYTKDQYTDKIKPLNLTNKDGSKKYGATTGMDVFNNFWEGKVSPSAGIIRDIWNGQHFDGTPVTPGSIISKNVIPLPIQTSQDLLSNPDAAPFLFAMIADGLGISTFTPTPKKKK